jgi:methionyl-tRNA formyltransferase|tara:strand:- start:4421 stop:5308 length:888 start_codon:yes stop_codon:yes gene_type:complete
VTESGRRINRVAYIGTPAIAVDPLLKLVEEGYDIPLVVTGPDKRRGRGSSTSPSDVKREAERLGLNVSSNIDDLVSIDVDLAIVVAFGQLIPKHILDHVQMINIHFSLLPRWRGAAPLERAILAGDTKTGVCIMELEETLDTGGIYRCVEIPIGPNQTLEELRAKSVSEGVDLLLQSLEEGLGSPTPQLGEPSYAHKISSSELEIDWGLSSEEILRLVRLGRAWTTVSGSRLRVHSAKIGSLTNLEIGQRKGLSVGSCDGTVELIEVQPEGRKKMLAEDWMNGLSEKTNGYLGNG